MKLTIQELLFNTKQRNIILAGSAGFFLAILFAEFAFASANIGAEFAMFAGFILVGLAFGLTRNILVPIFLFVGYNSIVLFVRQLPIELNDILLWSFQGIAIAIIVIFVNLIISRNKIDLRYYAITGAGAGFVLAIFGMVQVI